MGEDGVEMRWWVGEDGVEMRWWVGEDEVKFHGLRLQVG